MSKKKTPPSYGLLSGPTIVAYHSNKSSPFCPAAQFIGGLLFKSINSLFNLFMLP